MTNQFSPDNSQQSRGRSPRNLPSIILVGAISGLLSTFSKFGWDAFWPPRGPGRIPEPEVLVTMFTHHPTSIAVSHIISFLFCLLSGIVYGLLVEFWPIASFGLGSAFGFLVWVGAHEFVLPLLGLTPPTWQLPANEQIAECLGHVLWGLAMGVFYEAFHARVRRRIPWQKANRGSGFWRKDYREPQKALQGARIFIQADRSNAKLG
jgi:putative membrane protein